MGILVPRRRFSSATHRRYESVTSPCNTPLPNCLVKKVRKKDMPKTLVRLSKSAKNLLYAPRPSKSAKNCYTHPYALPPSSLVHIERPAVRGLSTRPRCVCAVDCPSRATASARITFKDGRAATQSAAEGGADG